MGPEKLRGGVYLIPCPYNTTVDLDNTFLVKDPHRKNKILLDKRCAACNANFSLTNFFRRYGLIPHQPQECCGFKACTQLPWYGTKYCRAHIFDYTSLHRYGHWDVKDLQECFTVALSRRWSFDRNYVKVIARTAEVEAGKKPGSDLVILDVEFLPASSQLLEFAIVEKVSGTVLIDTKVKHKNGLTFVSDKRNLFCEWISYRKACKVFGRKDPCVTGDGPDVDEIAEMLKNAGITHHTIILVWHTSNKDLSLL